MFKISLNKEDSFEYSTSVKNILLLLRTIYQNNDFITTTSQEAEELVNEINEVKDVISSDEQTSPIDIDVPERWTHKKDQKGIIFFIEKLVNEHQSKQKDYIRLLSISLDSAMKRRALKRMEFALKAATTGGDTEALVSQWADIDRSIPQEVQKRLQPLRDLDQSAIDRLIAFRSQLKELSKLQKKVIIPHMYGDTTGAQLTVLQSAYEKYQKGREEGKKAINALRETESASKESNKK